MSAITRARPPQHLADLTLPQRQDVVRGAGENAFRAKQLSVHYFSHHSDDPATMTDLPADKRAQLAAQFLPPLLTPVREQRCDNGATLKTAWQLTGGALIESVVMAYPDRTTVCVSSQAGCGMGCPFCATGQSGLVRNLSTAEIVAQVVAAYQAVAGGQVAASHRVSNVVLMGMGEPLANYHAVIAALHRMIDPSPHGLGMSGRNITVSTVGLVPSIGRLAGEGMPVRLAVSLHAPDDELRNEVVPINQRLPVAQVLDAARSYAATTGRRVSIEYALIDGVNDQTWRAALLAQELTARGSGWAHVNLIPLNPTAGSSWTASSSSGQHAFQRTLATAGIPVTVRDTRGRDIDGACGQLATNSGRGKTSLGMAESSS